MSETSVETISTPQDKEEFERGYADGIREAANEKAVNLTLITQWPVIPRSVCAKDASGAYYAGFDKGLKDGWQK